jgi:RimJ/RimL family protein N-acetyltransferase
LRQPESADDLWQQFEGLKSRGFLTYAIIGDPEYVNHHMPRSGGIESSKSEALGVIGYLDIDTKHRSLETGAVVFSKKLQRSVAATEAHYLQLRNVFEPINGAPYRRVSWKNNSLNSASRRAAQRIGYYYEGMFRNHWILNGRSRDSDWLSVIEEEWPVVKLALERWLDEKNFDIDGRQVKSLEDIRKECTKEASS